MSIRPLVPEIQNTDWKLYLVGGGLEQMHIFKFQNVSPTDGRMITFQMSSS